MQLYELLPDSDRLRDCPTVAGTTFFAGAQLLRHSNLSWTDGNPSCRSQEFSCRDPVGRAAANAIAQNRYHGKQASLRQQGS
jgi:hypothetical protein